MRVRSFAIVRTTASLKVLAAALIAGLPGTVHAQDREAPPAASEASDDAIVVTAQRREQRLQDVPLAVTALSGATLGKKGALTFQDYAGAVPSLSFQYVGPTGYRGERDYAIRGIYGSNTVGFYIDETPVPIVDPEILDVARIEVLRGPQATLYGSNSMGGTIKFVINQPKFNIFSGSAEGRVSTTAHGGIGNQQALILNVPIIDDRLAARIAVSRRDDAGYIDNYFDGYPGFKLDFLPANQKDHGVAKNWNRAHAQSARVTLRYEPVDGLTITPMFAYAKTDLDATPTYFGQLPGLTTVRSIRTPEIERTLLGSLNIRYEADLIELVNNFAYFRKTNKAVEDSTQLNIGYVPAAPYAVDSTIRDKSIYNEFRVQTKFKGMINFMAGAIYSRGRHYTAQRVANPGMSAANPTLPPIPNDLIYDTAGTRTTTEMSAYAEARLDLTATLQATGGLRYYSFDTRQTGLSTGLLADGDQTNERTTQDGIRPRFTLSWIPSRHLTLFSNYGKGFRPGFPGGRRASICGGFSPDVVSDTVTNYEIGAKTSFLDNRLQLAGTLYRMDWTNVQQTILLPCGFLETQNTGKARSQGVEFELSAQPFAGVNVDGSATYTDAKIIEAESGALAPVGSPILFVPKWKLSLGAGVEQAVSEQWEAFARADANYESSVLVDYGLGFARGGYTTLSARFGIRNDRWMVEIFGQNLTDRQPFTNLYTFAVPGGSYLTSTLQPRTIGIRASVKFGK